MLYLKDSYKKEFETEVQNADENKIILKETYFYHSGGGQPNDTGIITRISDNKGFKVIDVKKENNQVIHIINQEGLKKGDIVSCIIDWNRRYKLMRMHTAAHIISSIIHKTGAMITGNQLDLEKSRIDFSLEDFNRENLKRYIEKANEEIKKDHKVAVSTISKKEAEKIENLSKLAKGLPPNLKEIRIVKIGNVDEQGDGGTHIKSTKEIGTIKLLSVENKGRSNRRIYFSLE